MYQKELILSRIFAGIAVLQVLLMIPSVPVIVWSTWLSLDALWKGSYSFFAIRGVVVDVLLLMFLVLGFGYFAVACNFKVSRVVRLRIWSFSTALYLLLGLNLIVYFIELWLTRDSVPDHNESGIIMSACTAAYCVVMGWLSGRTYQVANLDRRARPR